MFSQICKTPYYTVPRIKVYIRSAYHLHPLKTTEQAGFPETTQEKANNKNYYTTALVRAEKGHSDWLPEQSEFSCTDH